MTMRSLLSSLRFSRSGVAGAEMALVTPLLITMAFGSFEIGNYFYSEHVVVKAVRDGARFASRQSFSALACVSGSTTTLPTNAGPGQLIDRIVRYGNVSGSGSTRLQNWTSAVTIQLTCGPAATYSGIYKGIESNVPVVSVTASTSYQSLFQNIGFPAANLSLNATSQSAVMGI